VQLQTVAHIIESQRVRELGKEHRNDMTPRTERTGSIGRAALAGQLHHQMGWNKIAELPEDGKLATSWRVLVFFHPCRVAGKFLPRQLFFYSGCGMTVNIEHFSFSIAVI
jgi:hypothetical protein